MTDKGKVTGKGRPPMDGVRKVQKKVGLAPVRWAWLVDQYGSYAKGIEALVIKAMDRQEIGIAPPKSPFRKYARKRGKGK